MSSDLCLAMALKRYLEMSHRSRINVFNEDCDSGMPNGRRQSFLTQTQWLVIVNKNQLLILMS